jgi:hypothetical protein
MSCTIEYQCFAVPALSVSIELLAHSNGLQGVPGCSLLAAPANGTMILV